MTQAEKNDIVKCAYNLKYADREDEDWFYPLMHKLSKYERKMLYRENVEKARQRHGILYICSYHANCAEGHKDYEGKMYYNKYWRRDNPDLPEWLAERIEKFIKKNNLMSIQKVSTAPIYLTTRSYCKHILTELNVYDALTERDINKRAFWTYSRKPKVKTQDYIKKRLPNL